MLIDKTTFTDISVFNPEEEFSIFHKLNFTRTSLGKDWLKYFFNQPFSEKEKIQASQKIVMAFQKYLHLLPQDITNGTILVMSKFLDYDLDPPPSNPGMVSAFFYKTFHPADHSIIKFSVRHFADFFRDLKKIAELLLEEELPLSGKIYLERVIQLLKSTPLARLSESSKTEKFSLSQTLYFGNHLYFDHRNDVIELMDIFGRLDAWMSMAIAMKRFDLKIPEFIDKDQPFINALGLYHLLLPTPIAYDIEMNPQHNFLFLTGANMAGKSTLIKSVGSAVFLAHIGMGVPVKEMQLTIFDGLLTNINVVDNIAKGESFFFNEVQRIKNTIQLINDGRKWLVLIDELFKGTNVQDAMKCSTTVIKGLIKMKNSLFILSTHLYEIGEELKNYPNISFKYFETKVDGDQLVFSYQLKEGISNDRLGYFILKKENVVDMLDKL